MKLSFTKALTTALILLASGFAAANDDEKVIASLLDTFLQEASANDIEAHDRFWSEDLIYTSSSGERFGKTAIMAGLAEAGADADGDSNPRYRAEAVTIQVFDDTALLTFELVAKHSDQRVERFYNSGGLRRLDGDWKVIVWHATRRDH